MATNFLKAPILSHSQKVCRTYKFVSRQIEAYYKSTTNHIILTRYNLTKIRAEIEKNRHVDQIKAKELYQRFYDYGQDIRPCIPFQFTSSPGGHNYGRAQPIPDWILDTWHPIEKAQYPTYFAKRDIRKRETLERNQLLMDELDKEEKAL